MNCESVDTVTDKCNAVLRTTAEFFETIGSVTEMTELDTGMSEKGTRMEYLAPTGLCCSAAAEAEPSPVEPATVPSIKKGEN